VVILLYLNNLMAFLYLRNVSLNQSLFGALGVLPVLMFGLYIFWLIVLLGGQITYATQNANYRISHLAWYELNIGSRRSLALLVLTLISRRFRDCRKAYNTQQLAEIVKIPIQILNACLRRLIQLGLVSPIPASEDQATHDHRYQPARPLDRITLSQFKNLFETYGEGPSRDILDSLDPVVREFNTNLDSATANALGEETLEDAVDRLAPTVAKLVNTGSGETTEAVGASPSREFEI
jgi:membrane protein